MDGSKVVMAVREHFACRWQLVSSTTLMARCSLVSYGVMTQSGIKVFMSPVVKFQASLLICSPFGSFSCHVVASVVRGERGSDHTQTIRGKGKCLT